MQLPLQLILLSVPSLIYLSVMRVRGENWPKILGNLGWQRCQLIHLFWGLATIVITGALGYIAFQMVPLEILNDPNLNISANAGWSFSIKSFLLIFLREGIYVALGEEIFFRGFLGGWLFRRFGFIKGNIFQSLIFLLPHLLLLLISTRLWPILFVQLVAGWLLGWLRYRTQSILPGWLVHSLINAFGALAFL